MATPSTAEGSSAKTNDAGASMLGRLEQLVGRASEEIAALRSSNAELAEQVQGLEKQIATLESSRSEEQGVLEGWEAEKATWTEQRTEIETRLEGLVSGLGELLSD